MVQSHFARLAATLCAATVILSPIARAEDPAAPGSGDIVENTLTATDAVVEFGFDQAALDRLGITVCADGDCSGNPRKADTQQRRTDNDRSRVFHTTQLDVEKSRLSYELIETNGEIASLLGGEFPIAAQQFILNRAGRVGDPVPIADLTIVHDPLGGMEPETVVFADASRTRRLFNAPAVRLDFYPENDTLVLSADLWLADDLADALNLANTDDAQVGRVSITIRTRITQSVVYDADGQAQSASLPPTFDGPSASGDFPTDGPDVIVGDLPVTAQFGRTGSIGSGTVGLAVGTTSCNKGNVPLNWFALSNIDHPMIPQNLYRMKIVDGSTRFEQIGQGWMKHAFTALQQNVCSFGCSPTGGTHLGVGCSDPYSSSLNASQCGLGARSFLNPWTGLIPGGGNMGSGGGCSTNYPARNHQGHSHNGISHRLQVQDVDLMPAMNPGATYYSEGQYITPHEFQAANGNQNNNASYRQVAVSGPSGSGTFSFSNVGITQREHPAIDAWTGATQKTVNPVPGVDGHAVVAYKVTDLGNSTWHYEYAVYNMNLDRSIRLFSIPVTQDVTVTDIDFHAPLNHTFEPNAATYSNDPWAVDASPGAVAWSTDTFSQDPFANAIRFGTLYNFRFDANRPPQLALATVGFFKTGANTTVLLMGPSPGPGCESDDDCQGSLHCNTETGACQQCVTADQCQGGQPCTANVCNNGACAYPPQVCDLGELCDPSDGQCKECFTNDHCLPTQVCDPDGNCLAKGCAGNEECDDGVFCNGAEQCDGLNCVPGSQPCAGQLCRESDDLCVNCLSDDDCNDQDPCNGLESCNAAGDCETELSSDCNTNGVEDACDLADGTSPDCNFTDTPDECDIAAGKSADDDGNGIPDECDALVSVELSPVKDNTMFESESGTESDGAGEFLFAGRVADIGNSTRRRGLIAFDLSAIPAGSDVLSARLTMTMSRTIAGTHPVSLHRASADWGEGASDAAGGEGTGAPAEAGDATWMHRFFDTDLWASSGGDFASTPSATTFVGGPENYTWGPAAGMTADVQGWLDAPASNFGWVVVGDESQSTTAKRFNTRENPETDTQPRLIVSFIPPPCGDNVACNDFNICTFDQCIDAACTHQPALWGDFASPGGICGPDGQVNIFDIFLVLDAFNGIYADGCSLEAIDMAGQDSPCTGDGEISLFDITAVLDSFVGVGTCCNN